IPPGTALTISSRSLRSRGSPPVNLTLRNSNSDATSMIRAISVALRLASGRTSPSAWQSTQRRLQEGGRLTRRLVTGRLNGSFSLMHAHVVLSDNVDLCAPFPAHRTFKGPDREEMVLNFMVELLKILSLECLGHEIPPRL